MEQNIILGGPGCGKTQHLLECLDREFSAGLAPDSVAYVAFTRKAAHEARDRSMQKFGFSEEDMPYFRTLHSLAFRQLEMATTEVMSPSDYRTVGDTMGLKFGTMDEESVIPVTRDNEGDQLAYLEQMSRQMMQPLEKVCSIFGMRKPYAARKYQEAIAEYKRSRHVYDFTDMLELFQTQGSCPEFKVVIVDEAQDLSPLQWNIVRRISCNTERIYIAGDDDQAIYEWSGADVQTFLRLQGNVHVLPLSHRLPRAVFDKAHEILRRIRFRFEKQWSPASEGGGVFHYNATEQVDFSEGSWYLLARNRYMLADLVQVLREKGYPYLLYGKSSVDNDTVRAILGWERLRRGEGLGPKECNTVLSKLRAGAVTGARKLPEGGEPILSTYEDLVRQCALVVSREDDWMAALRMSDREREYYRAVRRRGESLIKWPRITVSTIHQVKGGEADHVLLCPDMSYACYQSLVHNPDSEHRVYYVGATRAKKTLHLLYPRTNKYYTL